MEVELALLDRNNWLECSRLQLAPEQHGWVSDNVVSIAESKFELHYQPRVICAEGRAVGFLMYCVEIDPPDANTFWLFRFMVDARWQRRGYGRAALERALDEIALRGGRRVLVMHKPQNSAAAGLYRSAGFRPVGVLDDGDVLLELEL